MDQARRDAKNARRRAWRASNPELRAKEKAFAQRRSWQQRILYNAKSRSKRMGLPPCNLTPEDLVIPEFCPVLGIPINVDLLGRPGPNSPSMDRTIPELGYTKGNVEVISFRANRLKNDATYQELHAIANWVEAKLSR